MTAREILARRRISGIGLGVHSCGTGRGELPGHCEQGFGEVGSHRLGQFNRELIAINHHADRSCCWDL
jgi:hypothetical protein